MAQTGKRPAAMTAPKSLRAAAAPEIEKRSFSHNGRMYEIRAEKMAEAWVVAAYCDGARASRAYELARREEGDEAAPSPQLLELLNELMVTVEDDVRKANAKPAETSDVASEGVTGNMLGVDEALRGAAGGNRDH